MKLSEYLESLGSVADMYKDSPRDIYANLGIDVLDIELDLAQGTASLLFVPPLWYQAHPGIVHGGLVCTLCDTVAGALALALALPEGKRGFTKTLTVDFKKPMLVEREYRVVATRDAASEREDKMLVTITDTDTSVVAEASALFVRKAV